jgi:hypothetical protein
MCAAEAKAANHWFHIPLQTTAAIICVFWYFHLPSPNKAVLAMATMVALMTLMNMKPLHKGIYFLLVIAFFVLENHAINKERADAEQESERIAASFKTIADELKQSLDWISGGEGYTSVIVDLRTLQLEVITGGPQPLRDVYLNVLNLTHARENPREVFETAAIVNVGVVYPTVIRHLDYRLPVNGDSASFQINIYQTNGFFTEYLNLVKQGNLWVVKSTELYRNKDKKKLTP